MTRLLLKNTIIYFKVRKLFSIKTYNSNAGDFYESIGVWFRSRYTEFGSSWTKQNEALYGRKNVHKQIYTVRNMIFEPYSDSKIDWVDSTMKDIRNAFFWGKPAIILTLE